MSEDVSATMRVGITVILVAALVAIVAVGCDDKKPQEDLNLDSGERPEKAVVVEVILHNLLVKKHPCIFTNE